MAGLDVAVRRLKAARQSRALQPVLLAPLVLIAGLAIGYQRVSASTNSTDRLQQGTAWLAASDGTASLVDGVSGARLARVGVSPAEQGNTPVVEQGEEASYIVNDAAGTIIVSLTVVS
jgi:sirohydrochlorin ferrochelatase